MAAIQNPRLRFSDADISAAFDRDQFRLVYQPCVDLATRQVTGVEVFVRWEHPQYGLLPPGLFLDVIEDLGRAGDLTFFVLSTGLASAARWRQAGHRWTLSVNISPSDLAEEDFCAALRDLASQYGVPPEAVCIETPERALIADADTLIATLDDLRAARFQVALDGGGVVPVDLRNYVPTPFTSIKVGGQSLLRLAERMGPNGTGAISQRLRFARANGLEAIAVGAESDETLQRLRACGFSGAQGIWIQRPLPLEDLLTWDGTWVKGSMDFSWAVAATAQIEPPAAPAPQATAPEAQAVASPEKPAARPSRLSHEHRERIRQKALASPPVLEDTVEDFEPETDRRALPGQDKEACPPMAHLVQRRAPKPPA
ncbi:MAG TPA: hypothetical protein DCL48_09195, partial [Alphaproteobacteria bacterium]|nr:hypothetical protein [Alphaproteobacteria bacterium]